MTTGEAADRAERDVAAMRLAIEAAESVRRRTAPNPWVGAIVVTQRGAQYAGATEPPGGRHAEIVALDRAKAAGAHLRGASLYVTLEPCAHQGRTPPCTDAVIAAGVGRVVIGIEDPDDQVRGRGVEQLRSAGLEVVVGVDAATVEAQLAPYLVHRRRHRPFVTLKLAGTLDGRTAAPDGSSRWITGPDARADAHQLRAEHDAVMVGAGTVRTDDPALTVRHVDGPDPLRVVLGSAGPTARVQPALEMSGPLPEVLSALAARGVLSLLVEGGATVAQRFHAEGLVDRYVLYLAPALFGGDDGRPLFRGPGAGTIADVWRGDIVGLRRLGPDVRIDVVPLAEVA